MLLRDALLAWIHFALILTLAGCLCAEIVLYRRTMARAALETIGRVDIAFGIVAGLVVASGISRVLTSPKGASYYMHDGMFWTKMTLFIAVALLSIAPTVHFLRLRARPGDVIEADPSTYARTRAILTAEAALLLAIPLFAALMARGF